MRRALNALPDPQPFLRSDAEPAATNPTPPPQTTGDVVRATSPTQAVQMATSTLVMLIGLMLVLAIGGIVLLVLALR
jgi:hypothetical protein